MRLANTPHIDTCQTAQDVLARAEATRERRRKLFSHEKPKPVLHVFPSLTGAVKAHLDKDNFCFDILRQSSSIIPEQRLVIPSITAIQKQFCKQSGFTMIDLLSPRRDEPLVKVRQLAMALCRRLSTKSLPAIGQRFGGKDHTTVLHACRKMQPVMDSIEGVAQKHPLPIIVKAALDAFQATYTGKNYHGLFQRKTEAL